MTTWFRFLRPRSHVQGGAMGLEKVRARRVVYARASIIGAVAVLTARLWYLQIVLGPQLQQLATENHVRVETIEPPRGIIYDRYDQQLVENAPNWVVTANLQELPLKDTPTVLTALAQLTNSDLSELELAVQDGRDNGNVTVQLLSNIPRDTAFNLLAHDESLTGISVTAVASRQYVDGPVFSHILGYMGLIDAAMYNANKDTDHPFSLNALVGQDGIEQRFETQLRGQLGHSNVAIDATGRILSVLKTVEPVPGDSVELTIDATVQRAAYTALAETMKRSGATSGAVVAMDPRNGAVITLVTTPSFDNNLFSNGVSQTDWQHLTTDPTHPLVNHAVAAQYPPGPLLTPFILAGALQDGTTPANLTFSCPAKIERDGWNVFTSGATPTGTLTLAQALGKGCDTMAYLLADGASGMPGLPQAGMGPDALLRWLQAFGFGRVTQINMGGETPGFLPNAQWKQAAFNTGWTPVDTYLVAGGAGPLAVTPMQLTVAMSMLANGGTDWRPLLVQRLIAPDGSVLSELQSDALHHVTLSRTALAIVHAGLAENVAAGPSSGVAPTGIALAGMGGPAASESSGLGDPGLNSWWSGYGPTNDPQLVVTVLVAGGTDPEAANTVAKAVFASYFKPSLALSVSNVP